MVVAVGVVGGEASGLVAGQLASRNHPGRPPSPAPAARNPPPTGRPGRGTGRPPRTRSDGAAAMVSSPESAPTSSRSQMRRSSALGAFLPVPLFTSPMYLRGDSCGLRSRARMPRCSRPPGRADREQQAATGTAQPDGAAFGSQAATAAISGPTPGWRDLRLCPPVPVPGTDGRCGDHLGTALE